MSAQDASARLSEALDLVERGRIPDARRIYQELTASDPANAEAWMMLGSIDAENGDLGAAEESLRRAIALDPSMPEAHFYLANVLRVQGRLEEALASLESAVGADADYAEAWSLLGAVHGMLDHADRAEECCRRAAELTPGSPEPWMNLANARYRQGRLAEAADDYRRVVQLQPGAAIAWYMLGSSLSALGNLEEAEAAYRRALELEPGHAESWYGLGFIASRRQEHATAAESFRRALQLNPRYAEAHNALASTLQTLGQYQEALRHYDEALRLAPAYAEAHSGRGSVLLVLGDPGEAIPNLREAIRLKPDFVDARISLASALMSRSQPEEALKLCDEALQIDPDNRDAVAIAATLEQHAGSPERALERLQPWIERGIDDANLAIAYAEVTKSLDRHGESIEVMETLLQGPLPVTSQRNLHFQLGRMYDATGRHDQAFEHYRMGNELRPLEFDPLAHARETDEIIETCNRDFMASAPRATRRSDKPVFVVGMPRSGTSLVEQILASHTAVHGAGELPDLYQIATGLPAGPGGKAGYPGALPGLDQQQVDELATRYLEHLDQLAPQAVRVVDKMPGNFKFLGLIQMLFPDARVIHCTRDPLDTCLSCYFQDFARSHAYSCDLEHLAAFYNDYRRLMAHWKEVLDIPMLDVSYEELVENQEEVSRRMVDFCGLEWEDSCLRFHETERFVATASYDQVRRPLYRKSVARWKRYERHLGPLIEALG